MTDFRFRQLEKYRVGGTRDRLELAIPAPKSPSGKNYQYSPNPDAAPRLFLIGHAPEERTIAPENQHRIRRIPGAGETICPYSGYQAADEEFTHIADIEAVKKHVVWLAENDVGNWLGNMAKDFNRRQPRGGLVSISMDVKPKHRHRPLAIREDLLRNLECDICSRAYGVYALALFCPDCGAPNVALHFRREAELVAEQIALADEMEAQGRREIAYRLMGNAHEDVLTAFEATMKTVYRHLIRGHVPKGSGKPKAKKAIGNSFQNIERGQALFAPLGIDPFKHLNATEIDHLRMNIQKRHVLGHNLGIADEQYAQFAPEHEPGETVTILGNEIQRFADLACKVVEELEESLLPSKQ